MPNCVKICKQEKHILTKKVGVSMKTLIKRTFTVLTALCMCAFMTGCGDDKTIGENDIEAGLENISENDFENISEDDIENAFANM